MLKPYANHHCFLLPSYLNCQQAAVKQRLDKLKQGCIQDNKLFPNDIYSYETFYEIIYHIQKRHFDLMYLCDYYSSTLYYIDIQILKYLFFIDEIPLLCKKHRIFCLENISYNQQNQGMLLHKVNSTLQNYNQYEIRQQAISNDEQKTKQQEIALQNNMAEQFIKEISQIAYQQDNQRDLHDQNDILNGSYSFEEQCDPKMVFHKIKSLILQEDKIENNSSNHITRHLSKQSDQGIKQRYQINTTKVNGNKENCKQSMIIQKIESYSQIFKEKELIDKGSSQQCHKLDKKDGKNNLNNITNIKTQGIMKKPTHSYKSNQESQFALQQRIQPQKQSNSKKVCFRGQQIHSKMVSNQHKKEHSINQIIIQNDQQVLVCNDQLTSKTSIKLMNSSQCNILNLKSSINIYIQKLAQDHHSHYRIKNQNGEYLIYKQIQIKSEKQELSQIQIYSIIKKLQHRNIIKMYSLQKSMAINKPILVCLMDYYPYNLKQYIDQQIKINSIEMKIILFQIIKAINYLHQNGIYHRNLSVSSIFINQSLQVVLSNFSSIYHPKLKFKQYKYVRIIRPPQFILNSSYQQSSSGDIWQLGCLIFFLITKKMPFQEYSDSNLILQMIRLIGLPKKQDLKEINFTNSKRFTFPYFHTLSFRKILKCDDPKLILMLQRIFVYNPKKRASAIDLLKDQYFDDLRSYDWQNGKIRFDHLFYFQQNQLSEEDRKYILPTKYRKITEQRICKNANLK